MQEKNFPRAAEVARRDQTPALEMRALRALRCCMLKPQGWYKEAAEKLEICDDN